MGTAGQMREPGPGGELSRLVATAWIRAADAGIIDADELARLLTRRSPGEWGPAPGGDAAS
ncbi:hypothetical protein [Amycolatopsis minnesotensis]|uniref:Uncharacterized protein n=1 Tax=Amycolatopsis minnesotensis TaxID=337894 RepID=A0ABP5C4Q9_9PSEU